MIRFAGLQFEIEGDWQDITEPDVVPSLALPDGVGALQFSTVRYTSGMIPSISLKDLCEIFENECRQFYHVNPTLETFSFAVGGGVGAVVTDTDALLVKFWLITDSRNVAKVSYTTVVPKAAGVPFEIELADRMVRTIQFEPDSNT